MASKLEGIAGGRAGEEREKLPSPMLSVGGKTFARKAQGQWVATDFIGEVRQGSKSFMASVEAFATPEEVIKLEEQYRNCFRLGLAGSPEEDK